MRCGDVEISVRGAVRRVKTEAHGTRQMASLCCCCVRVCVSRQKLPLHKALR